MANIIDNEFTLVVDFFNVIPNGLICDKLFLDNVGLIIVALVDLASTVGWISQIIFWRIILLDLFDIGVCRIVRVSHLLFFVILFNFI